MENHVVADHESPDLGVEGSLNQQRRRTRDDPGKDQGEQPGVAVIQTREENCKTDDEEQNRKTSKM